MSLIPFWAGKLSIPPYIISKSRSRNNSISRTLIQECTTDVIAFEDEIKGYYKIHTSLPEPFTTILIKKKRSVFNDELKNQFILINIDKNIDTINDFNRFRWFNIPESYISDPTPDDIIKDWKDKFSFKEANDKYDKLGLRPAQLGALHSISAHFSTGTNHEPATIVLPTGVGKTETMLATLAYRRLPKLLVLIPSNILRKQLSDKFLCFGFLPLIGVLPFSILRPWVATITKGIKTSREAQDIFNASNVIIATPQILESSNKEAVEILCNGCTDLFIDEAHHSPATTWDKVRKYFSNKRIYQFTATPFRNDEKEIGGKIIYNYKLGDAQKDGYYKAIRFFPIENYSSITNCDIEIAKKAIQILIADLSTPHNLDHILLVRAKDKSRAETLFFLYKRLFPDFDPVIIHSGKSSSENNVSMSKVLNKESRIIICVDMFGEGFDLPQLKIAAIHDYHKSLAITLQFIGRFTRTSSNVGEAAIVLNVADPEVENGLEKLYSADAEWDSIIKRLSEERVDREIGLQDLIEKLKSNGSLYKHISLRSMRPTFTAQIYYTTTNTWYPLKYRELFGGNNYYHAISISPKLLVILGIVETEVNWGKYQELNDILHKLIIVYWDEQNNVLFVYSNDYDGFRVDKLLSTIFENQIELVSGPKIFNILNNVELPLVKNLGSSRAGVISFTQYFGPNVTEGLSEIEKNESSLSNIACLGYEDGERIVWGAAQRKGKIWSMTSGPIDKWMNWCNRIWEKINSDISEDNITQNFLRPFPLETHHSETAISIDWGEKVQLYNYDKITIYFGNEGIPLYLVDLAINNIGAIGSIEIVFSTETLTSIYSFEINKNKYAEGYKYTLLSGLPISIQFGKADVHILEEHVISDPFIINYNDGCFSYNKYIIQPNFIRDVFIKESIETWNWDNVPLNRESMGKEKHTNTIQYKVFEKLVDDYDIIINDDGKGESGDLICLTDMEERKINLTLVHCKNAVNNRVGSDIRDLYTVCGQAQKSIKTKHRGIKELINTIKKRDSVWQSEGYSRFLKGDYEHLAYIKNKSRTSKIDFNVIIVQPGISKKLINEDMLRLLATTELFIKKTCQGNFRVITSE